MFIGLTIMQDIGEEAEFYAQGILLLETGDSVLLESGDHIPLED